MQFTQPFYKIWLRKRLTLRIFLIPPKNKTVEESSKNFRNGISAHERLFLHQSQIFAISTFNSCAPSGHICRYQRNFFRELQNNSEISAQQHRKFSALNYFIINQTQTFLLKILTIGSYISKILTIRAAATMASILSTPSS